MCSVEFDFEASLRREIQERDKHMRTMQPKRRTVCKHWMRGLCSAGDRCTFLHQNDARRVAVCTFWQEGKCNRGSQCAFRHVGDRVQECDRPPSSSPPPPSYVDTEFVMGFEDSDSDEEE